MKKLVMTLATIFTMALSSLAFAADGGDLNKQQAGAETFMKAFGSEAVLYADFSKSFDVEFKKKIDEKNYPELQKVVKEKLGSFKSAKFVLFQRYDNADKVVYVATFSKEKTVAATFVFNKTNKMVEFALTPVKPEEQKAEEAKK